MAKLILSINRNGFIFGLLLLGGFFQFTNYYDKLPDSMQKWSARAHCGYFNLIVIFLIVIIAFHYKIVDVNKQVY